ncbi:helix-turn-helix domain-containing protein [Herbiconiux ginsengi]|uniref:HTH-type transcriptional regulator / antitoxin HipB n=1 Tax=Herbiconiux ginsengi TaxID=381665 RepID=A0A1H3MB84_9MICO|nr:helix-turn-helix domain-containing protein [Herbiconiux ginsengi]SDY73574.1 HTH-type transcriptional regulator / antitoxin HipB [Herbiconiux ginsengi]
MFKSARELGGYVRELRLERELTQAELAERAGVSREWLVAFENGKPSVDLARVLDVIGALGMTLDVVPDGRDGGNDDLLRRLFGGESE